MAEATAATSNRQRTVFRFLLLSIVILSLFSRRTAFEEYPTRFHLPRYLAGAIRARQIWLHLKPERLTSDEQAWLAADVRPFAEPPVLEFLTVLSYFGDHRERPWVAQLWSTAFWLLAGWPVCAIGRRLSSSSLAALCGLAVFWLTPLAVVISQMFQPEALMTLGLATALAVLVRWPPGEGWQTTLGNGAVGGVASLIKPGTLLFLLSAAYAASRIEREWRTHRSIWRWTIDPRTIAYSALLIAPSVAYAWAFLPEHIESRFLPGLALDVSFYRGWFVQVGMSIGWGVAIGGLLGAEAHRRRSGSLVPWGLWVGYVAQSYFFTWHTPTHVYYQTTLILVAAVGWSGLAAWLLDRAPVGRSALGLTAVAGGGALCCIYLATSNNLVRLDERLDVAARIDSSEIRRRVHSGTHVLSLDGGGGYVLSYYAWLDARPWPSMADDRKLEVQGSKRRTPQERMTDLQQGHAPRYFVITESGALQLHRDMMRSLESVAPEEWSGRQEEAIRPQASLLLYLRDNFRHLATTPRFVVYDLGSQPRGSSPRPAAQARPPE